MKRLIIAAFGLLILMGACKSGGYGGQAGNAERLDIFHQQKQVK